MQMRNIYITNWSILFHFCNSDAQRKQVKSMTTTRYEIQIRLWKWGV